MILYTEPAQAIIFAFVSSLKSFDCYALNQNVCRPIVTISGFVIVKIAIKKNILVAVYTECNRRNGPDFGRVFLMLNYTEKPQNTYIQSSMVTEI